MLDEVPHLRSRLPPAAVAFPYRLLHIWLIRVHNVVLVSIRGGNEWDFA